MKSPYWLALPLEGLSGPLVAPVNGTNVHKPDAKVAGRKNRRYTELLIR
jgi:hypothetical protein